MSCSAGRGLCRVVATRVGGSGHCRPRATAAATPGEYAGCHDKLDEIDRRLSCRRRHEINRLTRLERLARTTPPQPGESTPIGIYPPDPNVKPPAGSSTGTNGTDPDRSVAFLTSTDESADGVPSQVAPSGAARADDYVEEEETE